MIEKLFAKVRVKITGQDKNRFLNICIKNGLKFTKYKKENESYLLTLNASDYRKFTKLRNGLKVKIKRISKAGLLLQMSKYKKHLGLIIGLALGIFLYLFMYSFYWVIEVPTDGIYTQEEILQAASNAGVYIGAKKSDINTKNAGYKIMLELPLIQWISVNNNGSRIEIVITYGKTGEELVDKETPSNLVASTTGVITSIEVQDGMVEVAVGDTVEKGDLLVTGVWDTNRGYEEWELKENPTTLYASSRGIIMAETTRIFEVSIDETTTYYQSQNLYKKYILSFFGINFPFTFNLVPSGEYILETSQNNLEILGTTLPIYIKTQTLTKLEINENIINEDTAKITLENLLYKQIETSLGENDSLITVNSTEITYKNGAYTLTAYCICMENIALKQEIAQN
ncbi:MAG: sporulation protein YqfD [Clostridia bacterium]